MAWSVRALPRGCDGSGPRSSIPTPPLHMVITVSSEIGCQISASPMKSIDVFYLRKRGLWRGKIAFCYIKEEYPLYVYLPLIGEHEVVTTSARFDQFELHVAGHMDDSTMFMHPVAAVVDDDCAEITFPSLRALRDASLVMDAHAANTSVSGGTDGSGGGSNSLSIAPAAMELQASPPTAPVMWWNFSADSAQPDSDGHGKFHVVARPHGGSTPMRRGFGKTTPATYAQGHIMAERKRRENINRRFIELSTVVPGLKKMDKATILSDATAHIKELQEKIKALDAAGGRSIQTVALVHKPDKNRFPPPPARRTALPEIEARMSENSVNVRIHCANEKGLVVKVLAEMEEGLYLNLTSTTVIPFTAGTVIITITAKVEEGVSVTPDSILQRLNASLQRQDSFNSH